MHASGDCEPLAPENQKSGLRNPFEAAIGNRLGFGRRFKLVEKTTSGIFLGRQVSADRELEKPLHAFGMSPERYQCRV
jgi:hypothetical protein